MKSVQGLPIIYRFSRTMDLCGLKKHNHFQPSLATDKSFVSHTCRATEAKSFVFHTCASIVVTSLFSILAKLEGNLFGFYLAI